MEDYPLNVGQILVERLKRFTENMESKLMTKPIILTDEEIEAISEAADSYDDGCNESCVKIAGILRNLLERIKNK